MGEDLGQIQELLKFVLSLFNSLKSSPFHDCLFKRAKFKEANDLSC